MKKLNLPVTFILAVSLIITFSFAGIASKAPEVNDLKQSREFVANPIEQVNLKEDKTQINIALPSPPGLKKIGKDGFATVNNLNVRDFAGTKGKIISSINKGRRIYVYGEKDGWYYTEYAKGKNGWIYAKYVEFRANPLPQEPELKKIEKNGYVTPISLNVRNLGSMNGKVISSLKQGAKIYVYGEKDGWYYVEYAKGKKGWVAGRFIMFKDIDPVEDLDLNKIEKIGRVTANGLNIRSLGSIKGKVLIKVDKGTDLYVYGEKNGWYYVEFVEHAFGWVSSRYVEFKKDPPPKESEINKIGSYGYVVPAGLNVRDIASLKGKVISVLRKDAKIYVYGEKDGWLYVEYAKGKKGWVSDGFIIFRGVDPVTDLGLRRIEKLGTATVDDLNIRTLGSMKGKILISIDKGESLFVFGEKNGWYYVQFFEDAYGWIYGKYMTFK